MDFILGNSKVLNDFKNAKETGRLSHAYIIEGAEGSGRLTLARAIASVLCCEKEEVPCFSCNACKKVISGTHQDVKEVIHLDKASPIKIDTIRELIQDAYIKPGENDRKIFIIENAQQMGIPAQNALLQVFEEPPRNVVFFLLTTNRNLLLATLKSRAITVKTEKLSDEVILSELKKRFPDEDALYEEAVILSDGALGKAITVMSDDSAKESIALTKKYFHALSEYASFATLSLILNPKTASDRGFVFTLMTYFSIALRDLLALKSGYEGKFMFFSDREEARIISDRFSSEKLLSAYDIICLVIKDNAKMNVLSALSEINMAMCDDFER